MRDIKPGSVDMILCDLPYGTTQNKWDTIIPMDALWKQYQRISCGAIVLHASQPFTSLLVVSNPKLFKYSWVWEKSAATGHLNAKIMPMKKHEDILVFAKGKCPYHPQGLEPFNKITRRGNNGTNFNASGKSNFQEFTNYPRSILQYANDNNCTHPTQKPVSLLEYLIKTYTSDGATVLDNCAGSGSTGVACRNTNRNYILIEKDPTYYQTILTRLR
jgi:site-specific DNA-methyltransferase (adenine-specific)